MRKEWVKIWLGLGAFAMLSLLALQVYWVHNTYLLRQQAFAEHVQHAMSLTLEEIVRVDFAKKTIQTPLAPEEDSIQWVLGATPFVEVNIIPAVEERLDTVLLKNLLQSYLEREGVKMPFHARVVKENGTIFWQCLSTKIDQEVEIFKANLFPEDALEQEYFLQVSFADNRKYLLGSMWSMLAISVLLLAVIIGLFIFSFSTIYHQRQLSELKSDFINNMTHELKTPIATISLACEVLQDDDVVKSEMSRDRYIKMIKEENTRLGMLVENVLRTSLFEQGQLKMKLQEVNVHEVIQTVLKSFDLQFKSRRAMIDDQLDSVSPIIEGDILHITNMVYNLVDNALKYSLENPELKISTRDEGGFFVMEISDKGLGISKENQKRIFEKLYRVPTGNVHNVKGYGLGLSYVLGVVTKHLGTIKVDSELKKGTTFTIKLPRKHETLH